MRWKKQSAIQMKIDEHLRLSKQKSEEEMIVERHMRIADIEVMGQKLKDIMRERANSPEMRDVPGGDTGLLRRRKVFFRDRHNWGTKSTGLSMRSYFGKEILFRSSK